jgi:DNA adenine methylase
MAKMPDQITKINVSRPERPVLRYFGGKWRIADWIISHFPAHEVYVEPYGGTASVLMRKVPSKAEVYNDINGDVVNVFRVMRDEKAADRLRSLLELTPYAREEYDLSYAEIKESTGDAVERARRTIVRSFMGHGAKGLLNGEHNGWRSRRIGSFFPASDWLNYPAQIRLFIERLRGVSIENRPALEVLGRYDSPETPHYVDPPYVLEARSLSARSIYAHEMSEADHIALAKVLKSLQGMVVLSGYDSPLYGILYPEWGVAKKNTRCDSNAERVELLYLSPSAVERRKQKSLWAEDSD